MDAVIGAGFLFLFGLPIGAYLWVSRQIMADLELNHASLWRHMGSPRLRFVSPSAMAGFLRFCWSTRPAEVGDRRLRRNVTVWRVLLVWMVVAYFGLLIALIMAI